MTTSPLENATIIYSAAAHVRETVHRIDDLQTERLYGLVKDLQLHWHQIGADDTRLVEAQQKLAWFTNIAVSTPLPLGYPGLHRFCSQDELLALLNRTCLVYPDCNSQVQAVIEVFRTLCKQPITVLSMKVRELAQDYGRVALITGRQWLNTSVQDHIHEVVGRSDIAVLRNTDLRRDTMYDVIIITRPPRWIAPQLRHAVRAKQREIVTLAMFHHDQVKPSVLPTGWNPISTARRVWQSPGPIENIATVSEAELAAPATLEGFEVATVLGQLQGQNSLQNPQADPQSAFGDAEAFHLANGAVVLLSAEGKSWTVEQDGQSFQVEQRNAAEIQPGDHVVIRTQRDRDLITEFADTILGDRAKTLRELQTMWKQNLAHQVQLNGITRVTRQLSQQGLGTLATPSNVRRWSGDSFIHNQKYEHWSILMNYLGLAEITEQLWDAMRQIYDAHRQAGHAISQVIRARLESLSIQAIHDSMVLPPMPELGDERLTIYLISDRLGPVRDIRFTDMNRLITW